MLLTYIKPLRMLLYCSINEFNPLATYKFLLFEKYLLNLKSYNSNSTYTAY